MTLLELSALYADSAAAIRLRIRELQEELLSTRDDRRSEHLRRRILALQPLLQETRELAFRTAHYYDHTGGTHAQY